MDAIADTVGGEIAAKLMAKVKQSGSFGYTADLPESAVVRDGKFVLPLGRRMPLRDAAEAHVLGEKGGSGKILLMAPDSQH